MAFCFFTFGRSSVFLSKILVIVENRQRKLQGQPVLLDIAAVVSTFLTDGRKR
jgi:hypothetical protein